MRFPIYVGLFALIFVLNVSTAKQSFASNDILHLLQDTEITETVSEATDLNLLGKATDELVDATYDMQDRFTAKVDRVLAIIQKLIGSISSAFADIQTQKQTSQCHTRDCNQYGA